MDFISVSCQTNKLAVTCEGCANYCHEEVFNMNWPWEKGVSVLMLSWNNSYVVILCNYRDQGDLSSVIEV